MELVLTIPDLIAPSLVSTTRPLARRTLELLALDGFKSGELNEEQIRQMLNFEDRFEVHGFLKDNGVYLSYSLDELEQERNALHSLLQNKR